MSRKQTRKRILKALDKAASLIAGIRFEISADRKAKLHRKPKRGRGILTRSTAADVLSSIGQVHDTARKLSAKRAKRG